GHGWHFGQRRWRRRLGRRRGDKDNRLDWSGSRGWNFREGRLRRAKVAFEVFGGDLIERTGRNARARNAQFLGFGEDFLALDAELFCDIVNTNGHINRFRPRCSAGSSWPPRDKTMVWQQHKSYCSSGAGDSSGGGDGNAGGGGGDASPSWPMEIERRP